MYRFHSLLIGIMNERLTSSNAKLEEGIKEKRKEKEKKHRKTTAIKETNNWKVV